MQHSQLSSFFTERGNTFSTELKQVNQTINYLATARIIVALLLIVGFYYFITTGSMLLGLVCLALFIGFVVLVSYHENYFSRKVILTELVNINQAEIKALNFQFEDFETGESFDVPEHPYTLDLDVFGDNSLFQYTNRCCTQTGKAKLAEYFSVPLKTEQAVKQRQLILKELSDKIEFRQLFQATGNTIQESENEIPALLGWFGTPSNFSTSMMLNVLRYLLPALLIGSLVLSFFISQFTALAIIMILINWAVYGYITKKVNVIHAVVGKKNGVLNKYLKLLQLVNKTDFEHTELQNLKAESLASVAEIKSLSKIINSLDQRTNLLGIILNTFLLLDIHSVFRLERWKEKNKNKVANWLHVIAQFDGLNSLGNFVYCHPHFTQPIITKGFIIEAEHLGHPLMPHEDCITNSVTLGTNEKMIILTGANMSGKSTFLRSIGINTLMSLVGLPVFANSFSTPVVDIYTSMRVTDSLKESTSYFYAELKRLQQIIQQLESAKPMLVIVDEVLKGTNSDDKLSGSIALIKRFVAYKCLGIIATHDLELSKMEEELPKLISNFCFESIITENNLHFDYTLQNGIAKNKNATFLMKKMDII